MVMVMMTLLFFELRVAPSAGCLASAALLCLVGIMRSVQIVLQQADGRLVVANLVDLPATGALGGLETAAQQVDVLCPLLAHGQGSLQTILQFLGGRQLLDADATNGAVDVLGVALAHKGISFLKLNKIISRGKPSCVSL